jgi:acetyl esterase/lipase
MAAASPTASSPAPRTFALYETPPAGWEHPAQSELVDFWDRVRNEHRMLRNVTAPTITAFLPAPDRANGAAVLIAPGGSFVALSVDEEGADVARWLTDHGVAAFVVKYRLYPTPPDRDAFWAFLGTLDPFALPGEAEATADGQAALRKVRANAASFGVDPNRIGFLGFSAGGYVAINLAVDGVSHPAFVGAIYAPLRPRVVVPRDAPPMFAAIADNDDLFGEQASSVYAGWHAAHRPVELHVYSAGGHGFALRPQGTTSDRWIEDFLAWMQAEGLTTKVGSGRLGDAHPASH